jgi:hypothetical protein
MSDKLHQIEETIRGTIEDTTTAVKRTVDVRYQVGQHPWMALGVSFLAGYAVGSLGGGDDERAERTSARRAGFEHRYYEEQPAERRSSSYASPTRRAASSGLLDQLKEQFGDELEMLKGAAVASVVGLVRDVVRQNMPALHQEMERLRSRSSRPPAQSFYREAPLEPSSASYTAPRPSSAAPSPPQTFESNRSLGLPQGGETTSTQREVGRNPNYDVVPPAPHGEPSGRP